MFSGYHAFMAKELTRDNIREMITDNMLDGEASGRITMNAKDLVDEIANILIPIDDNSATILPPEAQDPRLATLAAEIITQIFELATKKAQLMDLRSQRGIAGVIISDAAQAYRSREASVNEAIDALVNVLVEAQAN